MSYAVQVHTEDIRLVQARQVSHELIGLPPSINLTLRCPDDGALTVSGWPEELRELLLVCLELLDATDPAGAGRLALERPPLVA
jgi:hypothetical protein